MNTYNFRQYQNVFNESKNILKSSSHQITPFKWKSKELKFSFLLRQAHFQAAFNKQWILWKPSGDMAVHCLILLEMISLASAVTTATRLIGFLKMILFRLFLKSSSLHKTASLATSHTISHRWVATDIFHSFLNSSKSEDVTGPIRNKIKAIETAVTSKLGAKFSCSILSTQVKNQEL